MSHDARVDALDGLLEDAGLDAVLATKDASIAYFTGFWGLQLERFFGVAVTPRRRRRADRARRWIATASARRRPASTRRSTTPRKTNGLPDAVRRRSTARSGSASRRTTSTSRARRR